MVTPDPNLHRCPTCDSPEISYDWTALVSMAMQDGKPVFINLGGSTEAPPDQLFCANCGEVSFTLLPDAQIEAACNAANDFFAEYHGHDGSLDAGFILAGEELSPATLRASASEKQLPG